MTTDIAPVEPVAETPPGVATPQLSPRSRALRGVALLPVLAFVFVLPARSDTFGHFAAYGAIFAMVGLSMNVLVGYTGQISLGQQAFVGLGALTAANVIDTGVTPAEPFQFALGMVAAVGVAAGAAFVLGAVALRIQGLYLALVTLVFGGVTADAVFTIPRLNGQEAGVSAIRPDALMGEYRFYLFALAMVAICLYIDIRVRRSKVGRGLVALRENELAAQAFGVDVTGYKLLGFVISGGMAGLAGGVFAFWTQEFSDKDFTSAAGFSLALTFVVMVVVGGLGNRTGVVIAAVFFALISPSSPMLGSLSNHTHWGNFYFDHKFYISNTIGALLLLQTIVMNPGGLGQVVAPFTRWFAGGRFSLHDDSGAGSDRSQVADARA
jgi:branched-chain amino acid transport system permease protein